MVPNAVEGNTEGRTGVDEVEETLINAQYKLPFPVTTEGQVA